MNVIDLVLVALVVGVVTLETRRGFGKGIFDFVALLISIRGVSLIVPHAAQAVKLARDAPANEAVWFAALFVVLGGVLLFIGKLAYDSTLISLDTFDPFLGGVLGFAVAVIIGHALLKVLAISAGVDGAPPEILAKSPLGMEFYHFITWHKVIDFLSSLA